MGTRPPAAFWPQLWATVVRNLLLKKRDTRKTLAEVLVPLYSLGVLIFLKMLVPNPNFPEVNKPSPLLRIHHDAISENHSVAVVADWASGTLKKLIIGSQYIESREGVHRETVCCRWV